MTNFLEELQWRGMVHDSMPGIDKKLNKGMCSAYIGFDPTADSLHIGSLVQIMILVHLQKAGHRPLALVGGATGMVGDPSGKSKERNLLSAEVLNHNLSCVKKQLEQFLDFDCGANSAKMVNNYDWFKDFTFLDFIRDVGKHISVNYMMAKDSVKSRLETGMSFTEFSYQLVQGYDFYHLYKNEDCSIQLGGSDQWGNITTGTELIRRMDGGEAFAITTPLIKKADGTKFGKTEGGNIWLDPEKTSPYKFYQYWIKSTDEDAENYIKIFTLKNQEEIATLLAEHKQAPHLRKLQKALAQDVTTRVHSQEDFENALKASEILFSKDAVEELKTLSVKLILEICEGVPHYKITKAQFADSANYLELLQSKTELGIFTSNGDARKMIQGGGVSINKSKISDPNASVDCTLLQDKFVLVQKGKNNYYLLEVE
jgi:tyrosyl-tRNA synthetase